jgi:hypothetical protein
MTLLSVEELSRELSVSIELLHELIAKEVLTPYGGKARLGEPKFSRTNIQIIKEKLRPFKPHLI